MSFASLDAGAIPLVTVPDDDSSTSGVGAKFEVNPEAISYLQSIRGKVAVVAIAGLYRTGKSYLLNRIMGKGSGFTVGPTVKACTKGIWLWGRAIDIAGSDTHVLFLDTEGLGSTIRGATYDSRIFALAILLSSTFVYNSTGVLDGDALSRLGLVVNLTKHIQVRAAASAAGAEAAADASEVAAYFPHFLWVVRDFSVRLERDGKRITSNDYLEDALKPEPPGNASVEQKNAVRTAIRSYFPQRDCVTMVRPVTDESSLNSLATLSDDAIRPEFLSQLETLKKRIFATAAPKSLYGRPLSGAMFATLVQEYCSAMNDDRAPIIKSAWDRVADQQCRDAVEVGVGVYKSSMAAAVGGGEAMDGTQIDAAHRIAMKAAMDAFLKGAIKDSETFDDNESSLLAEVDIAYAAFQRRNASLCAELCDRLFVDLSESAVSALKAAVDGKEDANASSLVIAYGRALQGLIDGFSERAKGVGRFQYLTERLTDVFQRTLQSAAVSIDDKSKKGIQELQSQVSTATARLEQASLDATKSAKEHSDALAVVREELAQAVRRGAEDSQQLSARLQSANEEAAQLKTSVETLTASLAAAEEQANASADELKKANTTIASLQASAASSEQATNQQLALLQSQLTDTAAKLQRETAKHTEEIAAFKAEAASALAAAQAKHADELSNHKSTSSTELEVLKTALKAVEAKRDDLALSLSAAETAGTAKSESIRSLEEQLTAATHRHSSLQEVTALAKSHSDTTIEDLRKQLDFIQKQQADRAAIESATSVQELTAAKAELASLKEAHSKLQGALDDCQRKLTDSEKTAAVQQERLSNAQSSLANAQHELSEQVSENKKLQESADGARVRLEGMAAEILTTRQMQADTRRQLDELLSAKDGDTSAQLTGVAKTLSELVTRSQAMDDKLAGYSQTTQQALNNQTSTLINMLESKEAQLTQLGDKLTTALLEAQLSRVALEQKEAEFEHLKGQLVEAKAKSAQRKAAYNDAKAVWKKDLADAQAAGARVSTLESTIQTYTADVAALQAECDTLRQALASAKTDGIAAYTLEIEQLKSQLASEQTRHRQDLAELNEAMAQLRAEVSNKDVDTSDISVEEATGAASSGATDHSSELQQLSAALAASSRQLEDIHAKRQRDSDALAQAADKIVNQEKALELLWSQKGELELELAQTKALYAEAHTQCVSLETDSSNLRRLARELKASMLASGTRLNFKDSKVLEFFHAL